MDPDEALMLENTLRVEFSQPKKAKMSENLKLSDNVPNVSPIVHQKDLCPIFEMVWTCFSVQMDICRVQNRHFWTNIPKEEEYIRKIC